MSMSSGEDRRRSSIHDDNAYYQNVHSSSRRREKEHRSPSEIRRNDEINQIRDEIKNLEQKIERLEMSRSPNRSRRSKISSTDRAYERRRRSPRRSSSRESNESQDRSHSHKRREQFEASKSLNRSRGSQYSRKETSVSKRKSPSPPTHRERPRIQSDKAASNSKSRNLESPGIVDKEQNRYESKARLDPGELTKFPFKEFEFIGDSLSHYLANAVRKTTTPMIKPYLKEQISLTDLYKSIKPVTFKRNKAIVSMAQFELNLTDTYYKTVQKWVKKVIDLLIGKGFEKIIILFPVIKPVAGNQKPVSMSSYFMYRKAFELVCDYEQVTLWWTPAAVFLQLTKDERCPGKMTFDEDEDGNMIPIKCKFYRSKTRAIFYPDRDRKHEVLAEINKLYRSAYFSGKRPEIDFVEE